MTTKEIARTLGIEPKTAEHHRAHVLQKSNARNSADLARYALRKGLLATCFTASGWKSPGAGDEACLGDAVPTSRAPRNA